MAQGAFAPGVCVLLTRSEADNQALAAALRARGAQVLEQPTVLLQPRLGGERPADAAALAVALAEVSAVAFTSPHAVRFFVTDDTRAVLAPWQAAGGRVAVVGAATARAVAAAGLTVDLRATPALGSALAAQLAASLPADAVVAHPCSAHARPELCDGLRAAGLTVRPWVCYANEVPAAPSAADVARIGRCGVVYLAAPSAADRLFSWAPGLRDAALVCIGPTTAAHLRSRHGVEAAAVAQDPSLPSVIAAVAVAATVLARPLP